MSHFTTQTHIKKHFKMDAILAFRQQLGISADARENEHRSYSDEESETQSQSSSSKENNEPAFEYKPRYGSANVFLSSENELKNKREARDKRRLRFEDEEGDKNKDSSSDGSESSKDDDLASETSSDIRCRQYAQNFQRNAKRRQSITKSEVDQNTILQMAALLDQERGLPCNTKKGKVSTMNQQEINYRQRKREALLKGISPSLTPDEAYNMLNTKYLRLTESNIEALEDLAMCGGFDVSIHAHLSEDRLSEVMSSMSFDV